MAKLFALYVASSFSKFFIAFSGETHKFLSFSDHLLVIVGHITYFLSSFLINVWLIYWGTEITQIVEICVKLEVIN